MNTKTEKNNLRTIDDRIKCVESVTVIDKYLVRYYLNEVSNIPVSALRKGYSKEKWKYLERAANIISVDINQLLNMSVGELIIKMDRFLATSKNEKKCLELMFGLIFYLTGYPSYKHESAVENTFTGDMYIFSNYVRISIYVLLNQYDELKNSDMKSYYKFCQIRGINTDNKNDIGSLLAVAYNQIDSRLSALEREKYIANPDDSNKFMLRSTEAYISYNILKHIVINPIRYYANMSDTVTAVFNLADNKS